MRSISLRGVSVSGFSPFRYGVAKAAVNSNSSQLGHNSVFDPAGNFEGDFFHPAYQSVELVHLIMLWLMLSISPLVVRTPPLATLLQSAVNRHPAWGQLPTVFSQLTHRARLQPVRKCSGEQAPCEEQPLTTAEAASRSAGAQ